MVNNHLTLEVEPKDKGGYYKTWKIVYTVNKILLQNILLLPVGYIPLESTTPWDYNIQLLL